MASFSLTADSRFRQSFLRCPSRESSKADRMNYEASRIMVSFIELLADRQSKEPPTKKQSLRKDTNGLQSTFDASAVYMEFLENLSEDTGKKRDPLQDKVYCIHGTLLQIFQDCDIEKFLSYTGVHADYILQSIKDMCYIMLKIKDVHDAINRGQIKFAGYLIPPDRESAGDILERINLGLHKKFPTQQYRRVTLPTGRDSNSGKEESLKPLKKTLEAMHNEDREDVVFRFSSISAAKTVKDVLAKLHYDVSYDKDPCGELSDGIGLV
ncbi:hypothetical protein RUND412_000026 [Rhizina undulata]